MDREVKVDDRSVGLLPAAGIAMLHRVRVHGNGLHGDVREQQGLPVFEAATAAHLLRDSEES